VCSIPKKAKGPASLANEAFVPRDRIELPTRGFSVVAVPNDLNGLGLKVAKGEAHGLSDVDLALLNAMSANQTGDSRSAEAFLCVALERIGKSGGLPAVRAI
jgi:hypothetical protein